MSSERNVLNLSIFFSQLKEKEANSCNSSSGKQCQWFQFFLKRYPTINSTVIATALLQGRSLHELEILALEIKDLKPRDQELRLFSGKGELIDYY